MFRKIQSCLILIIFLILSNITLSHAMGPTNIPGGAIFQNTTWDSNGSPYIINGNLEIAQGATLTIDPGVTVKFSGWYFLWIRGGLNAVGNSSNPIIFTSTSTTPAPQNWAYLRLNDNSNLQHAIIEYSTYGVGSINALPTISDCEMRHNINGMTFFGNNIPMIVNNNSHDNAIGLWMGEVNVPVGAIHNNTFSNNSSLNLYLDSGDPNVLINAENNWWGTTNIVTMANSSYTNYQNSDLPRVDALPFLNAAPPSGTAINPAFAPGLFPIGNKSVNLGSSLTFNVHAFDAGYESITYSVAPLPLVNNASFNSVTGDFSFSPDATQVGPITLTFSATNQSQLSSSETITITVVGPPATGAVTALSGRLLDANAYAANGQEIPIQNAVISILGSAPTATTNAQGYFTLSGIPSGHHVLDINSANAFSTVTSVIYAGFREEIDLIANVTNNVERPFYLPRIDPASMGSINSTTNSTISNPNLGISFTVPPMTAMMNGQPYNGVMSISVVPPNFTPAAMPKNLKPGLLITIQPVGVTFTTPVPITFPNNDNLPLGTQVNIWSLNAGTGKFIVVGIGEVVNNATNTGTEVQTLSGGLMATDWHFPMPPGPTKQITTKLTSDNTPKICLTKIGSSASLASGNLSEDIPLVSYRSAGQSRNLNLVYNSTTADPRPIIGFDTTIVTLSAVPQTISTSLAVDSIVQGTEVFTNTQGATPLNENIDETIRQAVQFDAAAFPTGSYPYELTVTNNFNQSSVANISENKVLVNNQTQSEVGAGWNIDGLQRLHVQANGDAVITDGAEIQAFENLSFASGSFSIPPLTFADGNTNIGKFTLGDYNEDGNLDIRYLIPPAGFFPPGYTLKFGDGLGSFTGNLNSSFSASYTLFEIVSSDFNRDNHLDMGISYSGGFRIGLGNGLGFFSSILTANSWGVGELIKSDLNSDGFMDFASFGTNSLKAFINNTIATGSSPYFTALSYPISFTPNHLTVADFNEDGVLDYFVTRNSPVAFAFYSGLGTVGPLTNIIGATGNTASLDQADFNNDGHLDAIVATTTGQIFLMLGDGLGNFSVQSPILLPILVASKILAKDFNLDGNIDFVVISSVNNLYVYYGDGTGSFQAPTLLAASRISCIDIKSEDLNHDTIPDLIVTCQGSVNTGTGYYLNEAINVFLGLTTGVKYYKSPDGDFTQLVQNTDGTFTRTLKDGTRYNFNSAGYQTSVIDPNGNTTTYAYNAQNQLTSITDPKGLVTTLNYSSGKLSSVVDPAGRTTNFVHDANGNLTQITDPDNTTRQFTYDVRHHLVSQTDKRNNTTTYVYNNLGHIVSATKPDNSTRTLVDSRSVGVVDTASGVGTQANPAAYARPAQAVATFTNGNNKTFTYQTDAFGATTSTLDPMNQITTIARNDNGDPTQITQPNGLVTNYTYDAKGNVLTTTEQTASPLVTTYTYEPVHNQITSITDALNRTTNIQYDANGNPTQTTDTAGNITKMFYTDTNCPGMVTSIVNAFGSPLASTTTFTYYASTCNLNTTTDALGHTTTLTYDNKGNVATTTDANNKTTTFVYNTMNLLTQVTDAAGGITTYSYDANGNLLTVTDANNHTTSFQYDALNRLTQTTDPLGHVETYTYDGEGNLIQTIDRKQQTITFQYDDVGRLINKTLPSSQVTSYTYDVAGNLISVVDSDSALSFTYDVLNRLTTSSTANANNLPNVTMNYTYDNVGNRTSLSTVIGAQGSSAQVTNYVYDNLNRLTTLSAPNNQVFTFGYDALSRRTSLTRPNGLSTNYTYDLASQLTNLTHPAVGGAGGPLASFTYSYDNVGNRTSMSTVRSALTNESSPLNYVYDNIYRLTQATRPLVANPNETFSYDSVGNRLNRDGQTTNATFDAGNRLLSDTNFTYTYDNNGNLVTRTNVTSAQVTSYTYDAENQLIQINLPNGDVANYKYDGLGRRIEKALVTSSTSQVTRFIYDNEDIAFEFDSNNTLQATYVHGPGIDEPLAMNRGGSDYFYHTDGLGSITDLTTSTGTIAQSYVYDSFGNIVNQIGSFINPYTYTGREIDVESGLYYYRARYYDPIIGRFLTEDPIGFRGGFNFYSYVQNNSLSFVDPTGLICQTLFEIPIGVDRNITNEINKMPWELSGAYVYGPERPGFFLATLVCKWARTVNIKTTTVTTITYSKLELCSDGCDGFIPSIYFSESQFDKSDIKITYKTKSEFSTTGGLTLSEVFPILKCLSKHKPTI